MDVISRDFLFLDRELRIPGRQVQMQSDNERWRMVILKSAGEAGHSLCHLQCMHEGCRYYIIKLLAAPILLTRWPPSCEAILHCVSKKLHPFYFCNNFVDPVLICIIFGSDTPEENCNKTCIVFPTTPIFCAPTVPFKTSKLSD